MQSKVPQRAGNEGTGKPSLNPSSVCVCSYIQHVCAVHASVCTCNCPCGNAWSQETGIFLYPLLLHITSWDGHGLSLSLNFSISVILASPSPRNPPVTAAQGSIYRGVPHLAFPMGTGDPNTCTARALFAESPGLWSLWITAIYPVYLIPSRQGLHCSTVEC